MSEQLKKETSLSQSGGEGPKKRAPKKSFFRGRTSGKKKEEAKTPAEEPAKKASNAKKQAQTGKKKPAAQAEKPKKA